MVKITEIEIDILTRPKGLKGRQSTSQITGGCVSCWPWQAGYIRMQVGGGGDVTCCSFCIQMSMGLIKLISLWSMQNPAESNKMARPLTSSQLLLAQRTEKGQYVTWEIKKKIPYTNNSHAHFFKISSPPLNPNSLNQQSKDYDDGGKHRKNPGS